MVNLQNLNQKELRSFVRISKFAGERFDLVQSGGGNSSVKFSDGTMAIKASGFALSDVDINNGYALVKNDEILSILAESNLVNEVDKDKRDNNIKLMVEKANLTKNIRPSIEVFLHSLLKKYTLHTHCIAANNILCCHDWEQILSEIFAGEKFITVAYCTPGIELAIFLQARIREFYLHHQELPEMVFMQNHGIIVSKANPDLVIMDTDQIVVKIENYLQLNYNHYKNTNKISFLINQTFNTNLISYLSEDKTIVEMLINNREILQQLPTCPDVLVFCGVEPCQLNNWDDLDSVDNFKTKYSQPPKVVVLDNQIFFIAKNISKAKEVEEVFKFHLLVLKNLIGEKNFLTTGEISYLLNWEAEKFRQNLNK